MSKTPPGTRLMSELPPRERFTVQHWRGLGIASILVLILGAGVIVALLRIGTATDRADTATDRADNAADQVAGLQGSVQALTTAGAQNQARLQQLGQATVGPPIASISAGKATPTPTEIAPVSPQQSSTQTVPVKPTQEQVTRGVAAFFQAQPPTFPFSISTVVTRLVPYVTAYVKAHPAKAGTNGTNGTNGSNGTPGATGSPGPAGQTGPGPTDEQINVAVQTFMPAAVADYLTANPPPSGSPGAQGSPGLNGTNGTNGTDGAQGPGPTEQQIADAVSAYFADHPLACKDGYTATDETVTTTTGPVLVQVCVADDQPTPTDVPTVPTGTTSP